MLSRATVIAVVFLAGCVSAPLAGRVAHAAGAENGLTAQNGSTRFVDPANLDPNIPTPISVVGHAMGDGAVRYEPAMRYLRALAESSPLITMTPYATSHEGRPLYFLTITSKANHNRLDEIKANNAKLADPRTLADDAEAQRILDTQPGIAWLAYSIHGDELSSTDAAIQLAFQLVAGVDEQTRSLRDELVIHIDPLMNPDGRERYLAQLQTLVGKIPNTDHQSMQHSGLWSAGRGNHYLFDLNRDWLMQVHPETRGRAARIIEWNPQLVVDAHEMGPLETYLFDPPREPINNHESPTTMSWRHRFSADQAKAFDTHGWSYYTQEWYEEWYPGYTNSWTALQGAVGLLYEQAGVDGAAVKQRAGNMLTYHDSVFHHLTSSLANLESLRANRRAIQADYLKDRRWAVSADRSGSEALLVIPPKDDALLHRFADVLLRHGLEFGYAKAPFLASNVSSQYGTREGSRSMPEGTLILRAAQPRRRLLEALLEFDPHMSDEFLQDERKDLENHRGTRMYDTSAWNLCMAYGVDAYWARDLPDDVPYRAPVVGDRDREPRPELGRDEKNVTARKRYGYVVDGASGDIYRLIARLLDANIKVRVAREPFTVGGIDYDAGSLLLRNNENQPVSRTEGGRSRASETANHQSSSLHSTLRQLSADLHLAIRPVDTALCQDGPDLGGQRYALLQQPRVAIATQWPVSTSSFGAIWHLLDARVGLRVSPINLQGIGYVDLRSYNVLVIPEARGGGALSAIINDGVLEKLGKWVEGGGTLVAIGASAAFFANENRELSSVRLRRDVLGELEIYDEALQREHDARTVQLDSKRIWGSGDIEHSEPESNDDKHFGASGDDDKLGRQDAWRRMFSPNGVMVRADLNSEHWLSFGVAASLTEEHQMPVMFTGANVLMAKHPVQVPVRLAPIGQLRMAGLLWPEARQRMANSAYATVERLGNGQIILFASDPFFRGYLEGTGRLLLNAVLLGPGLGASHPAPW